MFHSCRNQVYGGSSLPIKKSKNNKKKKNEIKNENKKLEKMKKNIIQTKKNPQNYHGLWVPNLIKFFIQKEKRTQNCHCP